MIDCGSVVRDRRTLRMAQVAVNDARMPLGARSLSAAASLLVRERRAAKEVERRRPGNELAHT